MEDHADIGSGTTALISQKRQRGPAFMAITSPQIPSVSHFLSENPSCSIRLGRKTDAASLSKVLVTINQGEILLFAGIQMLITCGGNILICDSDAATVLFSQHGASGRPFRMVYEVSSACFITSKQWAFSSPTPPTGGGVANKSSSVFQRMIAAARNA